jgi:hypothetical protein
LRWRPSLAASASFLYEVAFELAWAAVLVWLRSRVLGLPDLRGHHPHRFLGLLPELRLNFFVVLVMTVADLACFIAVQRRAAGAQQETAHGGVLANTSQQLRPGSG